MECSRFFSVVFTTIVCILLLSSSVSGERRLPRQLNSLKKELVYVQGDILELFESVKTLTKTVEENQSGSKDVSNEVNNGDKLKLENGAKINEAVNSKYDRLLRAFLSEKLLNRQLQQRVNTLEENIAGLVDDAARNMAFLKTSMNNEIDKKARKVADVVEDMAMGMDKMNDAIDIVNARYQGLSGNVNTIRQAVDDVSEVRKNTYKTLEGRISGRFTDVVNDLTALNNSIIDIQIQCAKVAESVPEKVGAINDKEELGVGNKNMPSKQEKVDDLDEKDRTIGGDLPIVDGWIVIMRRSDGSENFTRSWSDYKKGFGKKEGEFWAGNDIIHELTSSKPYQLRVDLEDIDGDKIFAQYEHFEVGPEDDKYRLKVSGYSGTAGDALIDPGYRDWVVNGQQFSTFDSDNDMRDGYNCAADGYKAGWWFNGCSMSTLTGVYRQTGTRPWGQGGIRWYTETHYLGYYLTSFMFAEMKIRHI